MQTTNEQKLKTDKPHRHIKIAEATTPQRCDATWQPEPCGLTREELRRIIADLLG
jgi:hypothetical protein